MTAPALLLAFGTAIATAAIVVFVEFAEACSHRVWLPSAAGQLAIVEVGQLTDCGRNP